MFARQAVRRFMTSAIRRDHYDPYDGVPGHNLPFGIKNKYLVLLGMMTYCASAFSIPFLLVRHHLLK